MSTYRVLTQHAVTGEWLSKALPVGDLEFGPELNGPGELSGTIEPQILADIPALTEPATTLIYVEAAGELVWGGLVWDARAQGEKWSLECASWSSYLQKRYDFAGELGGRGPYTDTDRCEIIRDIWDYAQSIADGDLGVIVDSTTSKSTVGTEKEPWRSLWWEPKALGEMVDDLVSAEASPDYTCTVAWNADRSAPVRRLRIGYPRLGARRRDISFASGVNIIDPPEIPLAGDEYAQVVMAAGAGDGSKKQRAISAIRNGRLRMEQVLDLPEIKGQTELARRASAERAWRQTMGTVEQITVRHHPAAPLGSWQIGDDVRVRVNNSSTDFTGWCRITGWTVRPYAAGGPQATLQLKPAASFVYGAA